MPLSVSPLATVALLCLQVRQCDSMQRTHQVVARLQQVDSYASVCRPSLGSRKAQEDTETLLPLLLLLLLLSLLHANAPNTDWDTCFSIRRSQLVKLLYLEEVGRQ
jgi:hypothetical protein